MVFHGNNLVLCLKKSKKGFRKNQLCIQSQTGSIWSQTEYIMTEIFYKQHFSPSFQVGGIAPWVEHPLVTPQILGLKSGGHLIYTTPFKPDVGNLLRLFWNKKFNDDWFGERFNLKNLFNWYETNGGSYGVTAQRINSCFHMARLVYRVNEEYIILLLLCIFQPQSEQS